MKTETFELIKQILILILFVLSTFVIPQIRAYYKSKTTDEQRKEIKFWVQLAVKWAEELYKLKGQGKLKKEEVIKFLKKMGFDLDEKQLGILIDMIVEEFNKNGWGKIDE